MPVSLNKYIWMLIDFFASSTNLWLKVISSVLVLHFFWKETKIRHSILVWLSVRERIPHSWWNLSTCITKATLWHRNRGCCSSLLWQLAENWEVKGSSLVMDTGQKFFASQVGSAIYDLGLVLENFPWKSQFFWFFSSRFKKNSSGWVKKYPCQRQVGLLFTAGQK